MAKYDRGQRVWHVQTGSPGTVIESDGEQLVVRFDGADNGVPMKASNALRTDPRYYGEVPTSHVE